MRWLLVLALLFGGAQVYIRFAPADLALWHVDPDSAPAPQDPGARVVRDFPDMTPAELWARLDAAARAEPRTLLIAGGEEPGLATWECRSAFWGFPDYLTARIDPTDTGARLTLLSRQRFGRGDMGVNAARVARWLARIEQG